MPLVFAARYGGIEAIRSRVGIRHKEGSLNAVARLGAGALSQDGVSSR